MYRNMHMETISVHLQPSYTQDLRCRRQAVRIALKEIESLSFNMDNSEGLCNLEEDLKSLLLKYEAGVKKDQGLVLHLKATNSRERAIN